MTRTISILLLASATALCAAVPAQAQTASGEKYKNLNALGAVLDQIQRDFVDKPDERKMIEGAIAGALKAIDSRASYFSQEEYQRMQTATAGEFGGLGIEVALTDGKVRVVTPLDDTPAARAGIRSGDVITHVDGQTLADFTLAQTVDRMRGRVGTAAKLTIVREGRAAPFELDVVRAKITIRSVKHRAEDDVGYIRISTFNPHTVAAVKDAVKTLRGQIGTNRLKGFILDLRNCPGGTLDAVVGVTDDFLESGQIVGLRGRAKGSTVSHRAKLGDVASGRPLIVLVNAGTAAGSEILAGALQDNRRATIIGTRSFGNGTAAQIYPVAGLGGAIRLTYSRYFTPSGRAIDKVGIVPDFTVQQDVPADIAKQDTKLTVGSGEERALSSSYIPPKPEDDRQLQFALNRLRNPGQAPAAAPPKPGSGPAPFKGLGDLKNLDKLD